MPDYNPHPIKRSMIVSVIGRPNVGKSSLFNRLMQKQHKALTHDRPGVTRDRHYGMVSLDSYSGEGAKEMILVDTGGFYPEKIELDEKQQKDSVDAFFNIMADHAKVAITESDLVLFVVDVREGLNPFDEMIVRFIRAAKKKMWLLVNKYDSEAQVGQEVDFYSLGIDGDDLFTVSAAHGRGIGRLKECLYNEMKSFENSHPVRTALANNLQKGVSPTHSVVSRVSIIGAPNAGKSTLLNHLLGAERALVSDIPGTTVDPIEGFFDLHFTDSQLKKLDLIRSQKENVLRHDDHLIAEYERFRAQNPDVYQGLVNSYHELDDISEVPEAEGQWEGELADEQISAQEKESVLSHLDQDYQNVFSPDSDAEVTDDELKKDDGLRSIHVVDTAGIRKKSKISGAIESQSVFRSLRCISESDIVIYMIDATKGISHQDRRLMDIAIEKGKSLLICLNKMDLLQQKFSDQREKREWLLDLRYQVPWLYFCDLLTISAKTGASIHKLKGALKKTIIIRGMKLPTSQVNRCFLDLVDNHSIILKKSGGKRFKVKYTSMLKADPPTFLVFANRVKGIPDNYKRYLKNGIRSHFGLDNTPIHLIFRKGGELDRRIKSVGKLSH